MRGKLLQINKFRVQIDLMDVSLITILKKIFIFNFYPKYIYIYIFENASKLVVVGRYSIIR